MRLMRRGALRPISPKLPELVKRTRLSSVRLECITLPAERGRNPVSHPKRRSKSRQAQAQRRLGNRECLTCRVSESGGRNCSTICRECLSTGQHGTMVVPGKLSRSPRGTHHEIIVEKPQPWEWPGRSLIGPCPRERTQRNTHGRLIRAESSAGVNAPTASAVSAQPRRRTGSRPTKRGTRRNCCRRRETARLRNCTIRKSRTRRPGHRP